jgi:hypothetical protein
MSCEVRDVQVSLDMMLIFSTSDSDHLAIRLIVVAEVMLLGFSFNDIQKELLKLFITCPRSQRFHDIELQIAAEARAQFTVARKTKFIAALAEMQICHRSDKAYPLSPAWDLIVGGWTIRSEFRLRNQAPVNRLD